MSFPHPHNSGKPKIKDGEVTFSYIDSHGILVTETKRVLTAEQIRKKIKARLGRFHAAPIGSRESDDSRAERKWLSAHPEDVLKEAYGAADKDTKMEFEMAFHMASHHGISDPEWVRSRQKKLAKVVGDDSKPLDGVQRPKTPTVELGSLRRARA